MNNSYQNSTLDAEIFEDRIDVLIRELDLAIRWDQPSILFAIYGIKKVQSEAESVLENKLMEFGQKVPHIQLENSEISFWLKDTANLDKTVFFVEGVKRECDKEGLDAYSALNILQDFFVENRIRIVFWLTEDEAINLAHFAPDFWAFRHRVIEFIGSPKPEQVSLKAFESDPKREGDNMDTPDRIDASISLRESLLKDWPEGDESTAVYANLLLTLGILHWRKGNNEKASKFLHVAVENAVVMKDNWLEAESLNAIALVNTSVGKFDEAIKDYKQAIQLAPDQIFPWNNLGNLYTKLNRYDEALAAYQKAVEYNPEDSISWHGMGNAFLRLGQIKETIAAYQHAIKLAPNYLDSWNRLGEVYANTGQIEEAVAVFQKMIEVNSQDVNSWIKLGNLYGKMDRNEDAVNAYQKVIGFDSHNASAWNELGNIYFKSNSFDEAITAYKKTIQLGCECGWSYLNLALAYCHKGKYIDAIPLFQKSIGLFLNGKEKAIAWNRLGDVYRRLNDHNNSIEAYRRAVEFDQESVLSRSDAVNGARKTDKVDRTIAEENKNLEDNAVDEDEVSKIDADLTDLRNNAEEICNDPDNKSAYQWNEIGHSHLEAGAYDEAILAYKKAIELAPDLSWPYINNLALAHYYKGMHKEENATEVPVISTPPSLKTSPSEQAGLASDEVEDLTDSEAIETHIEAPQNADQSSEPKSTPRELNGSNAQAPDFMSNNDVDDAKHENEGLGYGRLGGTITTSDESLDNNISLTLKETSGLNSDNTSFGSNLGEIYIENDPKNATEWNEAGNIYFKAGSYDKAVSAFINAIEQAPEFGWPYSNLGLAYCHKGKYAEAIPLFEKSIGLLSSNKEKAISWNRLGDAYRRLNDHKKSLAAYQRATELDADTNSLLSRIRLALLNNNSG